MPECADCGKSYKHKRSLSRHIKENHAVIEHWLCPKDGCFSKFIRRGYLSRHLIMCYGISGVEARETALTAEKEHTSNKHSHYENVNEDDTTLDLQAELKDLKAVNNDEFAEKLDAEFDLDMLPADPDARTYRRCCYFKHVR